MKKYLKQSILITLAFLLIINENIASENYPQIKIVTTSGSFIIELHSQLRIFFVTLKMIFLRTLFSIE
jgi:hypothetical protein